MLGNDFEEIIDEVKKDVENLPEWEQEYLTQDSS